MADFKPTDDQMNDEIWPVLVDVREQLTELQKSIQCPDRYVVGLLEHLMDGWD